MFWRKVLIVWAPLWAIVPWSIHAWNPWFERNKFHPCMHTIHGIHMLLTITNITLCMLMCILVYIVDVRATLLDFCYDRIHDENLANNFVWVKKGTNPYGPKRVWVPKTTPIVFDVGVGSRITWERWCLEWMRSELHEDNLDASLSREVWWEDHLVLEK